MKGFVPTPRATVDDMVNLLFRGRQPNPTDTVLDPGCGTGEFIDGIIRWCHGRGLPLPQVTGVESDPRHLPVLRTKYARFPTVHIKHADYLASEPGAYGYIVGNPPYVPITGLSEAEKARYRARYATAHGRFDLYLLFFEESLRQLAPDGRLVFITPEKYLYVQTAAPLRKLLARCRVEEIRFIPEDTFGELVTYPTITVVCNRLNGSTKVLRRDGNKVNVTLPANGDSWLPLIEGISLKRTTVTLADLCVRVSCGIATGADSVFIKTIADINPALHGFSYPTIAGRELELGNTKLAPRSLMLIPYGADSKLLPLNKLGAFRNYLMRPDVRERLLARTCVTRKPWYAFHETPPLSDILRPKILCKDIGERPCFWVDRYGEIVPRHSVYYIVPRNPAIIDTIVDYLRSPSANKWFRQNCQRASKGFLRLQSRVLQQLPIPDEVARAADLHNRPACSDLPLKRQSCLKAA